jgi:hypothetical protein
VDPQPRIDASPGGQITLRYWAAAKAAAGTDRDVVEVAGPVDLGWLVAEAVRRHPDRTRLADVLATCSVLIGDRPAGAADSGTVRIEPGDHVELLPPFAGG